MSARPEEKDLRRVCEDVWDAGRQGAEGEEALELRSGTKEEGETGKQDTFSGLGETAEGENDGEGDEEVYLGFLGCGAATLFVQTFTDTPIGGGDRIRGLKHEDDCPNVELAEEALGSSKVSPSGLWELAPPTRVLRGWGGLFAMGEE